MAKTDASNLTENNKTAWKTALGVKQLYQHTINIQWGGWGGGGGSIDSGGAAGTSYLFSDKQAQYIGTLTNAQAGLKQGGQGAITTLSNSTPLRNRWGQGGGGGLGSHITDQRMLAPGGNGGNSGGLIVTSTSVAGTSLWALRD